MEYVVIKSLLSSLKTFFRVVLIYQLVKKIGNMLGSQQEKLKKELEHENIQKVTWKGLRDEWVPQSNF